jgi:hypothetical protein
LSGFFYCPAGILRHDSIQVQASYFSSKGTAAGEQSHAYTSELQQPGVTLCQYAYAAAP